MPAKASRSFQLGFFLMVLLIACGMMVGAGARKVPDRCGSDNDCKISAGACFPGCPMCICAKETYLCTCSNMEKTLTAEAAMAGLLQDQKENPRN